MRFRNALHRCRDAICSREAMNRSAALLRSSRTQWTLRHALTLPQQISQQQQPPRRCQSTGVVLQPIAPAEVKLLQWMKLQEIKARKQAFRKICDALWSATENSSINWVTVTMPQCRQLLEQHKQRCDSAADDQQPHFTCSDWEVKQLYANTLDRFCAWRAAEEQQQRALLIDKLIAEIYSDIRSDIHRSRVSLEMSKNDLTFLLEGKLGSMPNADEVEAIWSQRNELPLVTWIGYDT